MLDKIDQKLEYDGGAHVLNCARAQFFHVQYFTLHNSQKGPYFTFSSPFLCLINFTAIFPMYGLGTTKATSKKNQVRRCFRFSGILLSEGYNDTHYEIIRVDT